MVAYASGSTGKAATGHRDRFQDRSGGRGEFPEKGKKILNSGNELKHLLKIEELAVFDA
jgi:hypothetical protein